MLTLILLIMKKFNSMYIYVYIYIWDDEIYISVKYVSLMQKNKIDSLF